LSDLYTTTPSQIVMYTIEYCGDCYRAKAYFEKHKIPYLEIGLRGNEEATKFVMSLNNGNRSAPTIVFPDGSMLVEPSLPELNEKFAKV